MDICGHCARETAGLSLCSPPTAVFAGKSTHKDLAWAKTVVSDHTRHGHKSGPGSRSLELQHNSSQIHRIYLLIFTSLYELVNVIQTD